MAPRKRLLPRTLDLIAHLGALPANQRAAALDLLGHEERLALDLSWPDWAHVGQRPPLADWRTWIIMAGRGFGKTRAGAEWVLEQVKTEFPLRIALVAATRHEARRIMVEGASGLIAIAGPFIASWRPSLGLLRFKSGAEAALFSGASPDGLRGFEHHLAWCDELAKWEKAGECWDMLQLGLRLGPHPRALVTTTPRPGPVLRRIMADKGSVTTGGTTYANPHLSPAFIDAVEGMYAGTRLGRQELDGELLSDAPGALWTVELIEACRCLSPSRLREGFGEGLSTLAPPSPDMPSPSPSRSGGRGGFARIAIGVDPPSGGGTCGIVVCALDADGIGHVLADHSVTNASPERWARAVADAAAIHDEACWGNVMIVAEVNQGGKMVESVLRAAGPRLRLKLVRASEGKSARADPVALLFEAGRVRVHGRMAKLEAELCGLIAGGGYDGPGKSPDRADAMVWALGELMLGVKGEPRVRGF